MADKRLKPDLPATSARWPKVTYRMHIPVPIMAALMKRSERNKINGSAPGNRKSNENTKAEKRERNKNTTRLRSMPITQAPSAKWYPRTGAMKVYFGHLDLVNPGRAPNDFDDFVEPLFRVLDRDSKQSISDLDGGHLGDVLQGPHPIRLPTCIQAHDREFPSVGKIQGGQDG